mmetsp:Transcript_15802/g.29188  ORF Transcript_15802/g.29188 Transcript_15802/m.29188 type:complete len:98 (+) Transcript_15802:102-395(+)
MKAAACAVAILLLACGSESALVAKGKPATNNECRSVCHRFGMDFLAEQFKEHEAKFKAAKSNPVKCCGVCDEVLPAESANLLTSGIRTPLRRLSRKP